MNDYIELRADIKPSSETAADILAAFLADAGYESFVPDDNGSPPMCVKNCSTPQRSNP